ncbi:MAG: dihydroneopterin aldolase [Thermodesulfobacteriota bacterium]
MKINIENLRLRTIIGVYDWEKEKKQDVIINIEMEFDGTDAAKSDSLNDTVDYKSINKNIINFVENGNFNLLETMVSGIGNIIMEDKRIKKVAVKADKPKALSFADSVSLTHIIEQK